MIIADSLALQQRIYQLVSAACAPVPVFDHQPHSPPDKFVRLDGFGAFGLPFKKGEMARHTFEVQVYVRPVADAGARGRKVPADILASAHAALKDADILGTTLHLELVDGDFFEDSATSNVRARYSIVL